MMMKTVQQIKEKRLNSTCKSLQHNELKTWSEMLKIFSHSNNPVHQLHNMTTLIFTAE